MLDFEKKMSMGKAINIVLSLNETEENDEDKLEAIKVITKMATHNSITKQALLNAIKFLLELRGEELC